MNVFCEKIGETIAYEEYPDGVRIIPHNKLEDILRRYSARFIIEVKPVLISPEMCLVECRATDKETGETVLKVGESNPSNLETEIARKYPGDARLPAGDRSGRCCYPGAWRRREILLKP